MGASSTFRCTNLLPRGTVMQASIKQKASIYNVSVPASSHLTHRHRQKKPMFVEGSTETRKYEKNKELEMEMDVLLRKLNRLTDMIKEKEVAKFLEKSAPSEMRNAVAIAAVEQMVENTVCKLFENAIAYLTNGKGNLQEKVNDLKSLVFMLENSSC